MGAGVGAASCQEPSEQRVQDTRTTGIIAQLASSNQVATRSTPACTEGRRLLSSG